MTKTLTLDDVISELCSGTINFDDEAKNLILQWVADKVVGEEVQHSHLTRNYCDMCALRDAVNKRLRDQRAILKQHGWKGQS